MIYSALLIAASAVILLALCARALTRMTPHTLWRTYFAHLSLAAASAWALLSAANVLWPGPDADWLSLDHAAAGLVLVMTVAVILDPRHKKRWNMDRPHDQEMSG